MRVVFCGTAASARSAAVQQYYAGPGNRFWPTLAEVGLTDTLLAPGEFRRVLEFGIGLTDVVKGQAGMDHEIDFSAAGAAAVRRAMEEHQPRVLCFTSKRAAVVFYGRRKVAYGLQPERIGDTRLFVAPSPSGAARRYWDLEPWRELAALAGPWQRRGERFDKAISLTTERDVREYLEKRRAEL